MANEYILFIELLSMKFRVRLKKKSSQREKENFLSVCFLAAIYPFLGKSLIAVGSSIRIYDIGKKKLLKKCENKVRKSTENLLSNKIQYFSIE